jgi:hypothetical protein
MNIDNISLTLFVGPQAKKYSVTIALEHNSILTRGTTVVTLKATRSRDLTDVQVRKGECPTVTVFERSTSLHTLSDQGACWIIEDLEKVIGTLEGKEFDDMTSALRMVAHQRLRA